MSAIKDARSGTDNSNLQEIIDAAVSAKHALTHGQNQYQTPEWLARACAALLPRDSYGRARWVTDVIDPQGAEGNLVKQVISSRRIVFELDNRLKAKDEELFRITGNCVRIGELMDELYPRTSFPCIVANPPFGIRWKTKDGSIDSTEWTWEFIKKRLAPQGFGFIISNAETLKRIGADVAESTYLFQEFPAGGIWDNCNVKLGIVHFHRAGAFPGKLSMHHVWDHVPSEEEIKALYPKLVIRQNCVPYGYPDMANMETLRNIINDERADRPPFNVYLGKDGTLKTYLSTYSGMKMKRDDIAALHRLQNCHPLSLTVEKELRILLQHTIDSGVYILEPAAKQAIKDALNAVKSMGCPIRPVTDFELIAYGDDHDDVECDNPTPLRPGMKFTKGKRYNVKTATYTFQDAFVKKVLTFGEDESECWMEDHDMTLHGQDRFTEVFDDNNRRWRFMDRPPASQDWCLNESLFWAIFKKPDVPTVAETMPDFYERNRNILGLHATMSGFQYFPGQHDYIARLGCKDYALVGADVGTGKTLIALSLIQLKSPTRTLIIAPQGTMRSSGDEDDVDYQPSQWITEIRRFAPGEPVFQLFSREDYAGILNANGGEFPPGIYVTYPQAYWQNGSFDHIPESWQKKHPEKLFRKMFGLPWDDENPPPSEEWFNRGVGSDKNGIRCVVKPSLAITIAAEQPEWDMVCVDEAHLMCNLGSQVTQNLLRLQPKFRYALTATPIPNFVNNLFSLMGWLCVPDWYKGDKLNVAWPYKISDEGKFKTTFMCTEVDKTVQDRAKQKNDRGWSKKGVKKSPTISSPARLLKILKPNLAYISKEECNPKQVTCDVIDVRVPLGADQQIIYEHWLNRENLRKEFPNPLTRALAQLQRLRGVCASPASTRYRTINRGTVLEPKMFTCHSDFNAKTVTVLQLIRDRLVEGEQVVIVSARCGQSTELQRRLREAGIPTARIDSTVSAEMHTAEANRFKRGDARVMFMGIKCAQGHSFDQCRNLIIGSLEWSYGSLHQAKGRVWRLTSKQQVRVWCVLHENTIEELLFDRVATKQDAATICLHGKRVPRAYHQADASEVLGEHIVNYKASDGKIMSEAECESQWPELRRQLVLAFNPKAIAA